MPKQRAVYLYIIKIINLIGPCFNDLEALIAAECLRQTLQGVVTHSQLSQAAAFAEPQAKLLQPAWAHTHTHKHQLVHKGFSTDSIPDRCFSLAPTI